MHLLKYMFITRKPGLVLISAVGSFPCLGTLGFQLEMAMGSIEAEVDQMALAAKTSVRALVGTVAAVA